MKDLLSCSSLHLLDSSLIIGISRLRKKNFLSLFSPFHYVYLWHNLSFFFLCVQDSMTTTERVDSPFVQTLPSYFTQRSWVLTQTRDSSDTKVKLYIYKFVIGSLLKISVLNVYYLNKGKEDNIVNIKILRDY